MKSTTMKRIVALLLCMVMVLGNSTNALADGAEEPIVAEAAQIEETAAVEVSEEGETAEESESEPVAETEEETPVEGSAEESTEAETPEAGAEAETPTEEAAAPAEGTTEETSSEEAVTDGTGENAPAEDNTEASEEELEEEAEAEPVVLSQEVDGITVTLTGPASSFEEGKTYSLQVTKLEIQEENAAAEEAEEAETTEEAGDITVEETATAVAEEAAAAVTEESVAENPPAEEETAADIIEVTETVETAAPMAASEINAAVQAVEEALAKVEEESDVVVENYYAFDIKLIADGQVVQPLGPVEVTFSGSAVADSVTNEETEVSVLHVDGVTGETQDMGAVATEGNGVAIETTHFSIYVIVDTGLKKPYITVNIEHYGTISTIAPWTTKDGKASAVYESGATARTNPYEINTAYKDGYAWFYTTDEVYNRDTGKINLVNYTDKLYTADENIELPNLFEVRIEELSKVCQEYITRAEENNDEKNEELYQNYDIEKVQITVDGVTTTYKYSDNPTITLQKDATIRFYYKEKEASKVWKEPVTFYDYNLTSNGGWYNTKNGAGTNSPSNYAQDTTGSNTVKMAMGQWVSGNMATWNWDGSRKYYPAQLDKNKKYYNNTTAGKTWLINSDKNVELYGQKNTIGTNIGSLNLAGGYGSDRTDKSVTDGTYFQRRLTYLDRDSGAYWWYSTGYEVRKGLTKTTISKNSNGNYVLKYNDSIQQPGFFETGKTGTLVLDDYELGFKQIGNTYILSSVYNGSGTKVNKSTKVGGNSDYSNIKNISIEGFDGEGDDVTFSNNFWPLDSLTQADYDAAGAGKMDHRPTASEVNDMTGSLRYSDDKTEGKHNWHFGMNYEFKFKIGDYTGPMNYYFRGDDDFFLYIDGKKAIEIGGIHSAVGQALDVRDWLETYYRDHLNDPDYEYTVSIFYMERGGYGSCCYMQYTLPNVTQIEIPQVGTTSLQVKKVWLTDDSKIDDVEVELLRKSSKGGEAVVAETVLLKSENKWTYTWNNLPTENPNSAFEDEKETYTYSAREKISEEKLLRESIVNPTTTSGGVSNITNTQVMTIPVEKVWADDGEPGSTRPQSVQVKLLADGVQAEDVYGNLTEILTLNEENGWKDSKEWSNLPKYKLQNGVKTEIKYTVEEISVSGYKVEISGSSSKGFTVTNTQLIDIPVEKDWVDDNNYYGIRPEEVQVKLLADGEQAIDAAGNTTEILTLSEANSWQSSWSDLPKYKMEGSTVTAIVYSVEEIEIPTGYDDEVTGDITKFTVTNTLETQPLKITKVSAEGNEPLEGAKFTLTMTAGDAFDILNEKFKCVTGESDENGVLVFEEIGSELLYGTYTLEETEAPTGYHLLEKPYVIEISEDGIQYWTADDEEHKTSLDKDNTIYVWSISNEPLTALPETGGAGTKKFTIVGCAMMMAAAVVSFFSRKKREEE